jgi:hypothetical protein
MTRRQGKGDYHGGSTTVSAGQWKSSTDALATPRRREKPKRFKDEAGIGLRKFIKQISDRRR